jgi:hypothetical protein
MPELVIDAISVAVDEQPGYRPATAIEDPALREIAEVVAGLDSSAPDRLLVLADILDGTDVTARAVAQLGAPPQPQPLYLVRSGPEPDPFVAMMPRLVHGLDWVTEDLGITHLDEVGGVGVLELLRWSADPALGVTVVLVDQPVFVDAERPPKSVLAVAFRVSWGSGPLRVLDAAERAVPASVLDAAMHRFGGAGPCDAWIGLHAGLRSGIVGDGERVLLHTSGGGREGWVSLDIVVSGAIRLAGGAGDER